MLTEGEPIDGGLELIFLAGAVVLTDSFSAEGAMRARVVLLRTVPAALFRCRK